MGNLDHLFRGLTVWKVECKKAFPRDEKNLANSNYSTPSKQKNGVQTKKTYLKLSSSNVDTKRSDSSEKSDSSGEKREKEKESSEIMDKAKSHHTELELDSPEHKENKIITSYKTLDHSETKSNSLSMLHHCSSENKYSSW